MSTNRKLKLPKSVAIMGIPFTMALKETDGTDKPWATPEEKSYGETHGNERRLLFNPNQTADQLHFTRLHEYVHAIFHVSGIAERLTDELEESIAVALEHGLAPLVRFK